MVLVIVGKCASGKTTCANFLKETYCFTVYEIGDFVRKQYSLNQGKYDDLLRYADSIYKKGMLSHFVQLALNESKKQQSENMAFSGIRTIEELKLIRNEYPNLILINIVCNDKNREKRYKKELKDSVLLSERTSIENHWNKEGFGKLIDYELNNNSTQDEFYSSIEKMIAKLLLGGI